MPVLFVNYEDIQNTIIQHIQSLEQKEICYKNEKNNTDYNNYYHSLGIKYCWFSSDYADGLVFDHLTQFTKYFIPFFEHLPGHLLEIRTKSTNIQPLLSLFSIPPKNTEIAFSLNPQIVIDNYEKKTPSLVERISAIKKLLSRGRKVGIRVMPILSFSNAFAYYKSFAEWLYYNIDRRQLHSFFIGGFVLQNADYKIMKKKHIAPDLLAQLQPTNDRLWRINEEQRKQIYRLFYDFFGEKIFICMDNISF